MEKLRIDINKIGPEGLDLDEQIGRAWLEDALGANSPFEPEEEGRLTVQLHRVNEAVHVRGRVSVALKTECSRCLGPAHLALSSPVEVTLFPRGQEPPAAADGEVAEEDMGVSTYDDEEIDLGKIVHDEVFLELPMNPLCAADCAGLCPSCGANLNERTCDCPPATDARWDALRNIKVD